jgi:predicted RNase H-like HicB family nuclease
MARQSTINVDVTVFFFREGDQVIAYAPTLDLSTSGRTITEAKEMFQGALSTFLESIEEMGTTEKVLAELGWRRVDNPEEPWRAPNTRARVPTHLLRTREFRVPLPA